MQSGCKFLKRSLKHVQKELKLIEDKLLALVKQVHQDILTRIKSISDIGDKTSLMLVVLTDGFDRFKSGSELCSYVGFPKKVGFPFLGHLKIRQIIII